MTSLEISVEKDALLVRLGAEVDAERLAQQLSVAELAKRAGLSKRGVIYSRKAQGDPRLSTLIRQMRAVGLRLVVTTESLATENDRK
jgi:DNA-binding phage protein